MSLGHIAVFMTRGGSLQAWEKTGMMEREISLYRALVELGYKITLVTYGNQLDQQFSPKLAGMTICVNRWGLKNDLYGRLIPYLHFFRLKQADLFKSNQFDGSLFVKYAANVLNKPFIARGGYSWSGFIKEKWGDSSERHQEVFREELSVFKESDAIVVTTSRMKEDIAQAAPEYSEKVSVIPNYVDTKIFAPVNDFSDHDKTYDFICVGRLNPQKNLSQVLKAIRGTGYRVAIVGEGELKEELQSEFSDLSGQVDWLGVVPHQQLPDLIRKSRVYVLASLYEGHPKTLIEAMSCGACVLGSDVPGISDVIGHQQNGYLCGTDSDELRRSMEVLSADGTLRDSLGKAARAYVLGHLSIEAIAAQESALYQRLMAA